MGILNSIVRGAAAFRADAGVVASIDERFSRWANWLDGGVYSGGIRINAESVKRIAAAQACMSIIGRNVAQMPRKLIEQDGNKRRIAKEHPEYQLISSRPNDRQTAFEFFQQMQGHFEMGNAYALKAMDRRGVTQQLKPMHPARVTPQVLSNDRMRYLYADPLTNTTKTFVQDEVFHLRNWSDDGYVGQSTISMGADIFGVALAAQDYTAKFFQNDSKPSLYFQRRPDGPNFKNETEKEKFREQWRAANTGNNRHKVAVIPPNMELKEFGISPDKSQLLDARKFSRIEICSLFGVPPHLIGETEKAATYASVEQFNIMFATQCLLPRIVVWEQAIQRDILQDDSVQAKFSMAALLRGDSASRTAAYAVAIQNGWLSQNDVRLLEDLDPIEDGDHYWRPLAWAPLGQISNPAPSGGSGGSQPSKQQNELEEDETRRGAKDVVHNAQVLAAIAGKSPNEATKALLMMANSAIEDATRQLLEAA